MWLSASCGKIHHDEVFTLMQTHRRSLLNMLFEAPAIGRMSPVSAAFVYCMLAIWTAVVCFPLYWILITSFKTATDVNGGPVYLPWIDFTPSLHAWRELLIIDYEDTLRSYLNSIVIAVMSTLLCISVGSMAAYALARITYRPKFGNILLFVLAMIAACVGVWKLGVDWKIAVAVAVAVWFLLARRHRTKVQEIRWQC